MHASEWPGQADLFGAESITGREAKEWDLAHGRPVKLRYRGKIVEPRIARDACQLHADFCRLAGVSLQRFTHDGKASDSLKRIVGAVAANADVTYDRWAMVLQQVLANPWWGEGKPSVGVVFGPGIVEQNLADPMHGAASQRLTAGQRADRDKAERTRRRLAFAQSLPA